MGIRPEGSAGLNCRWVSRLEGPSWAQGRRVIRWEGAIGGPCPLDGGLRGLGYRLRPGEDEPEASPPLRAGVSPPRGKKKNGKEGGSKVNRFLRIDFQKGLGQTGGGGCC